VYDECFETRSGRTNDEKKLLQQRVYKASTFTLTLRSAMTIHHHQNVYHEQWSRFRLDGDEQHCVCEMCFKSLY
jgi:hypothetical protein